MDNAPYVGSAANMTSGERRRQRYQMDFYFSTLNSKKLCLGVFWHFLTISVINWPKTVAIIKIPDRRECEVKIKLQLFQSLKKKEGKCKPSSVSSLVTVPWVKPAF